jgi:glycosyltransferase involved in cell wall biosynthesis
MSADPAHAPLAVLYSFPHDLGSPGIGWTAWNQAAELIAAGHDVTVVTTGITKPLVGASRVVLTLRIGRFQLPHRLIGRDRAFRHHDHVAADLVLQGRFDVVHTWPLAAERTLAAARRSGAIGMREAPNTHTTNAFGVSAALAHALGLRQPRRAAHTFNRRHLRTEEREWSAASAILVPSEPVRRSFVERGIASWRLARHRYGHRTETVDPSSRHRGDRFTALFLGRGEPRKGLHLAVEAWERSTASRHGRLLIHGIIDPAYRARISAGLRSRGVVDAGFTDDPVAALRQSDVLLLPSLEEGSALVTYEAQAQGCVPLVSDAAGAVLDHGSQGLVHPAGDVAALVEHLDLVSSDADLLERLRSGAIEHGRSLTWERATDHLVAAYRDVLQRDRRVPTRRDTAVVVCTRDRPGMLSDALAAIRASTPRGVEIIVVDSGSRTDQTELVARDHDVTYIRSDLPGLSIARNVGWRATDREVVVYTDDDCRPQPAWIDRLLEPFSAPSVGAVTGRMLPQAHRDSPPPYFRRELYGRTVDGLDAGHGALMAFRRRTLERLGGFDEVLGAGRRLAGAEDLDMFCRVIADGGLIVHRREAVVVHDNTRIDDAHARLLAGYGRGLGGMLGKWQRTDPRTGAALTFRVGRRSARRIVSQLRARPALRSELAQLAGIIEGVRAGRRAPLDGRRLRDVRPPASVPRTVREDADV